MSCSVCLSQVTRRSTLSGYVTDASTGEPLAGASLKYENLNAGVISNKYGFFSLTSEAGALRRISVSYVGYVTLYFDFHFTSDSVTRIELLPETAVLQEVAIEGEFSDDYIYKAGKAVFNAEKIRNFSSFGSEPDVLKSLQMLPGVQSGNEGTTNISVRGGSFDQNLILLDEAPVYNPSHALSFFSIFNVDALQSVNFYKGGIPVQYGGRLSSVVDIRMKEGNRAEHKTRGSIGVIASRLTTEGPISDDGRWSYMASGRYSYAGQVVNGIYLLGQHFLNDPTANRSTTDNQIRFYDLNAKINFNLDDKNHFYLSGYSGGDRFYFNNITTGYDLAWGNETMTLRWNHVYNNKLFGNTTLVSSDYDYEYQILNNTQYFRWSAQLNEIQVKQDYDWYANDSNHITFGFSLQRYRIRPGLVTPRSASAASVSYALEEKQVLAPSLYVGNRSALSPALQLNYGIRYSGFANYGQRTEYSYQRYPGGNTTIDSVNISGIDITDRLEPRASLSYKIGASDELPVALESAPPRLVVDALISNMPGASYVSLGWSGPANEKCTDEFGYIIPCGPTVQNGPYKINGIVRIREIETGTTVEMPFAMDDKIGMIKLVPDIQGEPGLTYFLEITFDYNGVAESYSSAAKMLPTPVITAIDYEIREGDVGKSDNAVPLISFTDLAGENFYLFQLCIADFNRVYCGGNSRTWNYSLIADTFLPSEVRRLSIDDGASVAKYAEFYPSPEVNEGAVVRMYSIDQVTYDFYRALIEQFSNDGGAFSPTPATPKGNISGDALGLFRAVEESSATVYF